MSEQLKPGAFRVWDDELKFYDEGDGRTQYFLYGDGRLFVADTYGADEPDPLMRLDEADPGRYQVERWTGMCAWKGGAIFEGDVLVDSDLLSQWGVAKFDFSSGDCIVEMAGEASRVHYITHPNTLIKIGTIHDSPETLKAKAREAGE